MLLRLEAARTPSQAVGHEALTVTPAVAVARLDDTYSGERRAVFTASGDIEVAYEAIVEVETAPADLASLTAAPVGELPPATLNYLLPSRYCPSERFETFVQRQFGALEGGDKVAAILSWIGANLEYGAGFSDETTTAADTFIAGAGVCRDFTHLTIALCRAATIPARAVSAHAWRLEPPDMHMVAEVFLDGEWRLVDPTGLAPIEGLVRVASGRDAGDIAFMTIFGKAELIGQTFAVTDTASWAQAAAND